MYTFTQDLDFLFWLKLVSAAITSILGMIAVLHDFKKKSGHKEKDAGRLNIWGKMTLTGLVVSALVGVAAQVEETREQKRAADKTADALLDLTKKNQKVLNNVGKVLRKTDETLKTQAKTYEATQSTLHGVQRNLQLIGNTINVDYSLRVPLDDPPSDSTLYTGYSVDLIAAIKKPFTAHSSVPGKVNSKNTIIEYWKDDKGREFYRAQFGPQSNLMPFDPVKRLTLSTVPFRLSIWKKKPVLEGTSFRRDYDQLVVSYSWDPVATAMKDNPVEDGILIQGTPRMRYESEEHSVTQETWSGAVFKIERNPGQVVSALDFENKFMLIETADDSPGIFPGYRGLHPIRFCSFQIDLGPAVRLRIPLRDAETDKAGSVLYHLPRDFSNLGAAAKQKQPQHCPDFPEIPIPTFSDPDDDQS
jgi:hypothetical protein